MFRRKKTQLKDSMKLTIINFHKPVVSVSNLVWSSSLFITPPTSLTHVLFFEAFSSF